MGANRVPLSQPGGGLLAAAALAAVAERGWNCQRGLEETIHGVPQGFHEGRELHLQV